MVSVVHNMQAMNANRQYGLTTGTRAKTTEKLSSGYKINRAADDVAGLAISEKMRRQIRGLTQASKNCQDGVSYVQVADKALDEVQDMLNRITELSVKAANDTNNSDDRQYINMEIDNLKAEMNRVFATTEFNQRKIWGPNDEDMRIIGIDRKDVTETRPAVKFDSVSQTNRINNTNKSAVPREYFDVSAQLDGLHVSWTGYNGRHYESEAIPYDEDNLTGHHSFKLSDYMDYSTYPDASGIDFTYGYTVDKLCTLEQFKTAFSNSTSNVSASISIPVSTNAIWSSPGNRIASFSASLNYDAQLVSNKDFNDNDPVFAQGTSIVNPANTNPSDQFEFSFYMDNIGYVKTSVSSAYYIGAYNSSQPYGYGLWWSGDVRDSQKSSYRHAATYEDYQAPHYSRSVSSISHDSTPDNASLNAILDAIRDSNNSGDSLYNNNYYHSGTYYISFALKSEIPYARADGVITNSVGSFNMTISLNGSGSTDAEDMASNTKSYLQGLSMVDIVDNDAVSPSTVRASKSSVNSSNSVSETHTIETPIYEDIQPYEHNFYVFAGTDPVEANRIGLKYINLNIDRIGLTDVNTLTRDDALDAINKVKEAGKIIATERSKFGSYQNRCEHAIANLDNVVENTTAAESQIRDANMAAEMMKKAQMDILASAGEAMISHANKDNNTVLALLS